MPVDEDALTNGLALKSKETEDKAIKDICLAMRSFYVKSSRWNMPLSNSTNNLHSLTYTRIR